METVLAENAKMKLPVRYGRPLTMLTKLGYANGSKCKWMIDCSPRFNVLNRYCEKSRRIPENTMREVEKLSGKLRVYLVGFKDKKQIGLQIGDSTKHIVERMMELLKLDKWETKFTAKVDYRGEQITSEGFEDWVNEIVQRTAFHQRIKHETAIKDQAASVFGGMSFARALEKGKVDPNGFKLTLSIML